MDALTRERRCAAGMMRNAWCVAAVAAVAWSTPSLGDTPYLDTGRQINAGSSPLIVGGYASPVVADWDNDGRKDLVIGQSANLGAIRLYLNTGADTNPVFGTYTYLQANGVPITTDGC